MKKFLKPGKIVIVLNGRYAGRKGVVLRTHDDGAKDRKFGYAVVVGIDRYPLKVTRNMTQKKIAKRSRVKPFIKAVNFNHLLPTRYAINVDGELRDLVPKEAVAKENVTARRRAKVHVRKVFEQRYKSGQNTWFFQKLRF